MEWVMLGIVTFYILVLLVVCWAVVMRRSETPHQS
jgi:hypothetical protein